MACYERLDEAVKIASSSDWIIFTESLALGTKMYFITSNLAEFEGREYVIMQQPNKHTHEGESSDMPKSSVASVVITHGRNMELQGRLSAILETMLYLQRQREQIEDAIAQAESAKKRTKKTK